MPISKQERAENRTEAIAFARNFCRNYLIDGKGPKVEAWLAMIGTMLAATSADYDGKLVQKIRDVLADSDVRVLPGTLALMVVLCDAVGFAMGDLTDSGEWE